MGTKINHIIKLYEDRRIPTFNNALSKTLLLASGNEHTIKLGRADKEYQKIVAKFGKPPGEEAPAPKAQTKTKDDSKNKKPLPKAPPVDLKKLLKEGGKASKAAKRAIEKYNAERVAETKDYTVRVVLYTSAENRKKRN